MKMSHRICTRKEAMILLALILTMSGGLFSLEPPTKKQLAQYRHDGTLARRIADAKALGNDRVNPGLLQEFRIRLGRTRLKALGISDAEIDDIISEFPPGAGKPALRNKGNNKVFVLLIDFPDYTASDTAASINGKIFGDGDSDDYPYESLRNYYRRSSYNQLELQGSTLGWYRSAYTRADVPQTNAGRENLIKQALTYFDGLGHDFSQYDNDNDGVIDYFLVIWTGPAGDWATFWWGYYTGWSSSFILDGKQFSGARYSWQWELYPFLSTFYPDVTIHETGHALGLPDLYDYNDTVGPNGGVGGLDMMDGRWGDHNGFSKMLLDWLTPQVLSSGSQTYVLRPTGRYPDAVIFWPNYDIAGPFTEFFMVQNRTRVENDFDLLGSGIGPPPGEAADGLLIWHIDANLDVDGRFAFDNSYTMHKFVRLMEADGLEEIEQTSRGNAGDYYVPGNAFGTGTVPNTTAYDGSLTKVDLGSISTSASDISCSIAVVAMSKIIVSSPNGGESWTSGSSHAITWKTAGTIGNVKLEYSTDGGESYAPIIASTPNTGTYAWTVPYAPSTSCILKASDAANEALNDVSNAVFTIVASAPIMVTSPAGGEAWIIGSTQGISWLSSGVSGKLNINLYRGTSNLGAIATGVPVSNGVHNWKVGYLKNGKRAGTGSIYRVSIASAANKNVKAISKAYLSLVKPKIAVKTPVNGATWKLNSVQRITWTYSAVSGTVNIFLYRNGVLKGQVADGIPVSDLGFLWTVGALNNSKTVPIGAGYSVRVKTSDGKVSGKSGGAFTIQR